MTMQTKNWKEIKFKDFVKLQRGFDLPRQDRSDGEYPVIASTSITAYHDEYKVEPPCVTTGRSGALGEVLYVKERCWPLNTVLWVKDFKGNDPYFVFSLLKTLHLEQYNSGAGVPTLNRNHLDQIKIEIPPIADQKDIADILSAYDDLIENNTRRIKILEQMAQAIYTEWFVNFHFPGYEKAKSRSERSSTTGIKMIDSGTDFGKIPEGWQIADLGSILDIKSGYSFKSNSYDKTGLFKIVTIKNIHDGKFVDDFNCISDIPEKMPDYCKLLDGDILLSLTGNVGRVCIVYGKNLLLNQRVGKIMPNKADYKSFIYSLFRSDDFKKKLELLSNGVAQQNLSPVQTLNLKIILPPSTLIAEYENVVEDMINLSISLNKQNQNLCQTRDLLLPKLVTGEIRV